MMLLHRNEARMMDLDTFDEGEKGCVVAESISAHMISFGEDKLLAVILNHTNFPAGYVALLNLAEVESLREALNRGARDLVMASSIN
jgi:hypothetical protein